MEQRIVYNDKVVRQFIAASVLFGLVGMLVGVIVALQLAHSSANVAPLLTFGRLRPLHTNAVIFAFVGNMMFAGVYYSTQRLLKARLASDLLSAAHFWGWQLIIVAAAISLPLGITTGKEYAELEWPIDIAITGVWVIFAINFFWTLYKRNERQLYVAIWFYMATIITIAVLHIVNSLAIPVSLFKSYSLFGGTQDALVQWWYGHNAVAFFLTTPILGVMYYFVPKAANRPVYSYRLSIIHFWALVFLYIWAGPHHLLYTALPDWVQTLGMIFSVVLIAPSWGGMINGLLTLRGGWSKLRLDPVIKFFAAAITFYGMATFEGPLLSIKGVNGLAHYTDWIVGHAHLGALGWNGFMAAGMFYWLVPRLFGTELKSKALANMHFWISFIGILFYVASLWAAGITQGLMWRQIGEGGGLAYPNFLETVLALKPMYYARLLGGTLYMIGFCLMAYNLVATALSGKAVDGEALVVPFEPETSTKPLWTGLPVIVAALVVVLLIAVGFLPAMPGIGALVLATAIGVWGIAQAKKSGQHGPTWHHLLEGRALPFAVFTVFAVLVGGVAELIPSLVTQTATLETTKTKPYSPLELQGRDIYVREGCYTCHSQMIRPFAWEVQRYGDMSSPEDSIFDHPFQWGSKRTGPDLARVGGKYPHVWHYEHMIEPAKISAGSNMPRYPHLATTDVDFDGIESKVRAMRSIGVPYSVEDVQRAPASARAEAAAIGSALKAQGVTQEVEGTELVALIAYLQRLGKPQGNVPQVALAAAGGAQ